MKDEPHQEADRGESDSLSPTRVAAIGVSIAIVVLIVVVIVAVMHRM